MIFMGLLKKNIWSLFYIIVLVGGTIVVSLSYNSWINTQNHFKFQHENVVKIISNSTNSFFEQHELTLDIVIKQITRPEIYSNKQEIQRRFNSLIGMSKTIKGIALRSPNGDLINLSSNMNIKNMPNLIEQSESKDSFLRTLNSNKMILGRTYYFQELDKWLIPMRKAIRNKKNEVIAVLTAGVELQTSTSLLKKDMLINSSHLIGIVKESRYRQVILSDTNTDAKKLYNTPATKEIFDTIFSNIETQYKQSIEHIKKSEKIVRTSYIRPISNKKVLSTMKYNNRYNLWIISQIPMQYILEQFYSQLYIYILIFIIVNITLYVLFRYIANFEESKQSSLYHQATHNSLTNLPNRLYLSKHSHHWFINQNNKFSLYIIDMDNFKHVNDNYGQEFGDLVIKTIAMKIKKLTSENDFLMHHGGDEFIVFANISKKDKIINFAQEILNTLNTPYIEEGKNILLRASIGISTFPKDGTTFDELMRCADASMQKAKKKRNTFFLFKDDIKEQYMQNLKIENELKLALTNDEISMVYQPQINADGSLYGVEALVRWKNEKLGIIPPDIFVPIAEKSGMIRDIGKFIIKKSLTEISLLQKELKKEFQLSINISVLQFIESDFLESLLNMIKESKLAHKNITLEITENFFIEDFEYIKRLLEEIEEKNIQISLDDFGTGYSSLSLLNRLSIDEIKIDKSFVDNILDKQTAQHMIQSILSIGDNFNMYVITEGIETKAQFELIKSYKCKIFQGYYFSKPIDMDILSDYIQNHHSNKK